MSKKMYVKVKHTKAKRELKEFLDTHGSHGITYGVSGSGKTTQLLYILDRLRKRGEIIVWRDTRKNNEMSTLGQFGPLRIFVPQGCSLTIKNALSEYEIIEIKDYNDIFDNLNKDKINIIAIETFLLDPMTWLKFYSIFFEELVNRAVRKQLKVPLALFFDEFNQLCPSRHLPIGKGQVKLTAWIARNMETLRATKVRIVAASHGVTKLEKSIRDSFTTHFYKRVMGRLGSDVHALKTTTTRIENLKLKEVVILTVGKYYSEPMIVPDYKVGEICDIVSVEYEGVVEYDWLPFSKFSKRKKLTDGDWIRLIKNKFGSTDKEIGEMLNVSQPTITEKKNYKKKDHYS